MNAHSILWLGLRLLRRDEIIEEVHSYVSRIKSMEEVREGYMTFGDLIDMEREEAAKEATNTATWKTKAIDILELLEEYGEVPNSLRRQIEAETDMDTLKRWLKLAARVDSIEEFQEKMDEEVVVLR